jgi:hypothetical protein
VNTAGTIFAILSCSVVVLCGIAALIRAIWHLAQDLRDNKIATRENTKAINRMSTRVNNRITRLERWRATIEKQEPSSGEVAPDDGS